MISNLVKCMALSVCLIPIVLIMDCDKSPSDPDPALFNLRLTEIHYNPSDTAEFISDSLEFIELKNTSASVLDIGSLAFTEGIKYTFPTDATLDPGSFFVVASNRRAFTTRYGIEPSGVFDGQLKNSEETITLFDVLTETVIFSQTYADTNGWPPEADGKGYSLVPVEVNPSLITSGPEAWRKSVKINGSPGADDILLPVDETLYDLRITEIHYHPADPDTFHGDSLEFVELKNTGTTILNLGRVGFTKGIKYTFSDGTLLDPGSFIVLASNKTEFERRYATAPFDTYTGQLSNSGETLQLEDVKAAVTIIAIEYADHTPWPKDADGDGYSLVPYRSTPERDQNNPAAWRRSFRRHGSPGTDDPGIIVVNEVVPYTDGKDAIELYNPGDADVDIGGWFLTDRKADPIKFVIPSGTVIAAGAYLQFNEDDFANDEKAVHPFSLSAHGDEVYLMADSTGITGSGYWHGFGFGELEKEISYGRYITGSGNEVFTVQSAVTLGQKNAGPRIGPLIISEIMYKSPDGKGDFIEITNVGLQEIRLYDPANPQNTWKVDGIKFSFPEGKTIKSGESIIIASNLLSVEECRARYNLSESVTIFSMMGTVADSGEVLSLLKPEEPYVDDSLVSVVPTVPFMLIDNVEYEGESPWPTEANGDGKSLQRIAKTAYGNDYTSWKAAIPTPGLFE